MSQPSKSWATDIAEFRGCFEQMLTLAAKLAAVPAAANLEELQAAWQSLAYGTQASGPVAAAFAVDHLSSSWQRFADNMASGFRQTLIALSGRIQAAGNPAVRPIADFGDTVTLLSADDTTPTPSLDSGGWLVCGGNAALTPDHPLRRAIAVESELYWPGYAMCDEKERKWVYILAHAVMGPRGPQAPDYFDVQTAINMTSAAAYRKRQKRAEMQAEMERNKKDRADEEARQLRRKNWSRLGAAGEVDVLDNALKELETLRGKVKELETAGK